MKHLIILLGLCGLIHSAAAQTVTPAPSKPLLQLSGIIVEGDSLVGVPFASIIIKGTKRVTVSDVDGFFTIVASPGDELQFLSINHKNASYKLEDTLKLKHYFKIQQLFKDTILLAPVTVYPWPSKEEFKRAFLHLNLSETDYERAARNLDKDALSYGERNLQMDPQANYEYAMKQYIAKVHSGGQQPINNLLNPIAWAKFIDALSKGKFKKQPTKKPSAPPVNDAYSR
ncbi:MAG: hypothetical protein ACXVPQ_03100 [Bacteroidia bacterium]